MTDKSILVFVFAGLLLAAGYGYMKSSVKTDRIGETPVNNRNVGREYFNACMYGQAGDLAVTREVVRIQNGNPRQFCECVEYTVSQYASDYGGIPASGLNNRNFRQSTAVPCMVQATQ